MSNSTDNKTQDLKPHYMSRSYKMRERFCEKGADSLADHELIELILYSAIPRKDVEPIAKELLSHFGNIGGIFNAPSSELSRISGLNDEAVNIIKVTQALMHRIMKEDVLNKPVLNSWTRLVEYCNTTMAHEGKEHFRILFLNKKNELIADEIQQSGTVDHTPAYPREIMKRALELNATALILVHNHPSGDPTPSEADIDMTFAIKGAGEPFNIVVHDHLIVSKNGTSSMRNLDLI